MIPFLFVALAVAPVAHSNAVSAPIAKGDAERKIRRCIVQPQNPEALRGCINDAEKVCPSSGAVDQDGCFVKVDDYVDRYIKYLILHSHSISRFTAKNYADWSKRKRDRCLRDADLDGPSHDIEATFCTIDARMAIIQKHAPSPAS